VLLGQNRRPNIHCGRTLIAYSKALEGNVELPHRQ